MTSLEIARSLDASPDRVWRAFTDPTALTSWFWPHLDNTAEIDLRPGGRYRITGPRAQIAVSGEFLEVEAPKRLVFTWQWDGDDEVTRVTVELHATGEGTQLLLVHDRHADAQARDNHDRGWQDCLDRLPGHLAS